MGGLLAIYSHKNNLTMTNEITIDIEKIRVLPDNSITDSETIRQIALWSIKMNDNSLNDKIRKEFHFAGLYPHVMKIHDIVPENLRKDESSSI